MSDLGNKEIFSQNLKFYMDVNEKTRGDIVADLSLPYSTFADWENGVTYPRIDKIELLAHYFGIQKSDLIENKAKDKEEYYRDNETAKMAQEIYDNPDYRILFDASRNLSPKSLKEVLNFIDFQKNKEGSD